MSILARAPAMSQRAVARFSTSAPSRAAHGHYNHIPFDYASKPVFAAKVAAYCGLGFSIPFFAAWWQLSKQGA